MDRENTQAPRTGNTQGGVMSFDAVEAFEQMKAELALAFAAPDSAYEPLAAETIILRNAQ